MATESRNRSGRRAFLKGLAGAASGTLAVPATRTPPGRRGLAPLRLEDATRETFGPLLGDTFTVALPGGGTTRLTLVGAADAPQLWRRRPAYCGTPRRPFSIAFRGEAGLRLPQETYAVRHRELGEFRLFVVPAGPEPDARAGASYEAVFG